jgi:hypothetical protein
MTDDEEDKPTVVLDLNALKKHKLKQEDDLSFISEELEFSVSSRPVESISHEKKQTLNSMEVKITHEFPIILFDFQSDFFEKEIKNLPTEFKYHVVKDIAGLNKFLGQKKLQLVFLNYDVSPKAVNQLTSQIKQKFPHVKTLITAKSISPEKAKIHAKTPSGADSYFQLPFKKEVLKDEIQKLIQKGLDKK